VAAAQLVPFSAGSDVVVREICLLIQGWIFDAGGDEGLNLLGDGR
jgi:hypothetical protein